MRFTRLALALLSLLGVLGACTTTPSPQSSVAISKEIARQAVPIVNDAIDAANAADTEVDVAGVVAKVAKLPHVTRAYATPTSSAVVFEQDDGATSAVLLSAKNDDRVFKDSTATSAGAGAALALQRIEPLEFPTGSKALILAPFQRDFKDDLDGLQSSLEAAGFTVDRFENADADVDKFRGSFLAQYSVVYISTHGYTTASNTYLLTGSTTDELDKLDGPAFQTSSRARTAEGSAVDWITVTPKFMDVTMGGSTFPHTFVFIDACESALHDTGNGSFEETLLGLGAGGFSGWTETVNWNLSQPAGHFLWSRLLGGDSLADATAATKNNASLRAVSFVWRIFSRAINVDLLTYAQRLGEPYFLQAPAVPGAPQIGSFVADPATISSGGSSTLSWIVSGTGPITLTIDQGVGDVTGLSSVMVSPASTTTYTLTATNSAGSDTKAIEVGVSVGNGKYVLSGNADGTGTIGANDDLDVYLNGTYLYHDTDPSSGPPFGPLEFSASPGDALRIVATNNYVCGDLLMTSTSLRHLAHRNF